MSSQPDYLDETSGRTYALLNLGCAAVVWAAGLLATLLIPGDWRQGCWTWAWGAAGALTLGYLTAYFWRFLRDGGTYRIVVRDGRLDVTSPHRAFGPSFSVALADVERLVVRSDADGPAGHEVHTRAGRVYEIAAGCGERLFEALRRLRPDLAAEGPTP
jgi:hypothetical protein